MKPIPLESNDVETVLIVDDAESARMIIKNTLKNMKITNILEASDGNEAIQTLIKNPNKINLIICDWNMPGINGVDFLQKVRTDNPEIPFLMLTARADPSSIQEAKQAGVSGYIIKPLSPNSLASNINRIMEKQKKDAPPSNDAPI